MLRARYIMIGGFLGAGKTTSILRAARMFDERGLRVGLITNDQSVGLVDTAMLGSTSLPTEEISGGCFCCKFNSLVEAAERLTDETRPDVFLAEPVGSCTDLQATVSYPLKHLYGESYSVAPLSVLIDPIRAQRLLGLRPGKNFSPKVGYIYGKQLEEADLIVINKCDLLDDADLDALEQRLRESYPQADVMRISARRGDGVESWLDRVIGSESGGRESMDIDYDVYADGEALLGWLNASATLTGTEFDGNALLQHLVSDIGGRVSGAGIEIAHLKATLAPSAGLDLAVANLVREDANSELSHQLSDPLDRGDLIVNLRAEGDPETLRDEVLDAVAAAANRWGIQAEIQHAEAFRPSRPNPTHRYASG